MHEALVAKLSPGHIKCSGRFTALLAFILGETWTDPAIHSAAITSDGFLVSEGEFFGPTNELVRNLRGVAKAAGLTPAETKALLDLSHQRIENYSDSAS
jgi:hypothetical protein